VLRPVVEANTFEQMDMNILDQRAAK